MASPMPVLPLVASITVCPGLSSPDCSAASITPSARRSLTEPSGLKASILTKRLTPCGASLLIRTTGVWPTVSRMFLNLLIRLPCSDALLGIQCIKNTLSSQSPGRRRLHCGRGNAWAGHGKRPPRRPLPYARATLIVKTVCPNLLEEATHPRCGSEGYPDGPGRASKQGG